MLIRVKEHTNAPDEKSPEPFLNIFYQDEDALRRARVQLKGREYSRQELAIILRTYNQSIGNDDAFVMRNIERFASEELPFVVTGQQLGFMGGPAYTILKGITCLRIARKTETIPLFWLATEDHDIAEIDHAYLIDGLGNLQRFYLSFPKDGRSVEDLTLSQKHMEEIERFLETVGVPIEERPQTSSSYALTMAKALAKQFAGTGLVFLEPHLLRSLAVSFFRKEIKEHEAIQDILKRTTANLISAGVMAPLEVGTGTNLFLKSPTGQRQKLRWDGNAFIAGTQIYSLKECLALCDSMPERFSPSAAARPVLQSALLPVLAYIAGPSEFAYYRQLGDYHRFHDVPMPCIIPRIQATLIPPQAAVLLEKCSLEPWEAIPYHWSELMPSLNSEMEILQGGWLRLAARSFGSDLEEQVLMRTVRQGVRKLQRKVIKARLRRQGLPSYGLHFLRNLLSPHSKPQERVLNWWGFQAESTENLIEQFTNMPEKNSEAHFYSYIS